MKAALFAALFLDAGIYLSVWLRSAGRAAGSAVPSLVETLIGFVTNFFDTLGIGSFAPSTSFYKLRNLVPDQHIPGTLNVGHAIPTLVQALIFITVVKVDIVTLALLIGASAAGAWLGAGVVARWSRRKVQIGMGLALLGAAALMALSQLNLVPGGGVALGLEGPKLWIGLAGNFFLGSIMTIGIGLYAPCMILISLLGMDPRAAFPIMMGSCAFLMPVAGVRFIRENSYCLSAAVGLAVGGIPAVLLAAFVVKSLPLAAIRWLVVCVVAYTAIAMLRSAFVERGAQVASMRPVPGD